MDKELGETVLKKNFQGMTDHVNEFTRHLLEEIKYLLEELTTKNYFIEILLPSKSMNHDDQKFCTKSDIFITKSRESVAKELKLNT